MYQIKFHTAVKKDINKFDKKLKENIYNIHLKNIENNPFKAEPLSYEFKGLWSYHFNYAGKQYRIVYEIYPEEKLVLVIMIGIREKFYQVLKRRIYKT